MPFLMYRCRGRDRGSGALWVIQPEEIRSTPVAAIAGAVSRVIRPEASVIARPSTICHRAAQRVRVHVVEQYRVDPVLQRLGELVERIDLELDLDQVAGMRAGAFERGADAAGERDVVVLDQHRVIEAEAMVGAAAEPHRLLFEHAQAGRGLAGADDLGLVVADRIGQRAGRGRDARQAAEKVERGRARRRARRARGRRCARRSGRARSGRRPRQMRSITTALGRAARRRASAASSPASTPGWRAAITASTCASSPARWRRW